MSLRLITGRAGSGKTEQCMQEIAAAYAHCPRSNYLLITPEQATFVSEKRLIKTLKGQGGFNVKVLSFRRFVWAVLQQTGGGLSSPLDKVGKSLILRSLLEKHKGNLKSYRRVYQQKGFLEQLAAFMDELRSYQVLPEDFDHCLAASEAATSGLHSKLSDMQAIYRDYCQALTGPWLDSAGALSLLSQKLNEWPELKETEFWLDGFHGFTPSEYQVIRTLLAANCRVRVTLNLPAGALTRSMQETEVFYPPWETAQDFLRMCQQGGYELEPTLELPGPELARFTINPTLAWLEQIMGQVDKSEQYQGEVNGLSIQGYGNLQQEVEGLANQILQTLQRLGCRYRDVTVLARQPELYESALSSVFSAYSIPFFLDKSKSLTYHPLLNLMRTLLSFIAGRWNHQDLFAYMKTGLAGLSLAQTDRLENYCLAHGIRRIHWESKQPWQFSETIQDVGMEALRQQLWQPLARLEKKMKRAVNLREMMTAIYEHLVGLHAEQQCRRLAYRAREAGQIEAALIHEKIWADLLQLFDQIVVFLGEEPIERLALAGILESGLMSMETLTVPPALDQVTISSLDRSRTPQARAVWILGVNEGVLPARSHEGGLLTNRERQWLQAQALQLAPDADKRLFSESYLIYIALTRATDELHLSFARADYEGKGQAPSPLLQAISRRLPRLEIEDQALVPEALITRPRPTLNQLSVALQKQQVSLREASLWRYVYSWFDKNPQWQWDMQRIRQGLKLKPLEQSISPELSQALFGKALRTSVTRLEQFQACPFAHFMAYSLELKPREEYEIRPPEVGNFFHDSLESLIKEIQASGQQLGSMTAEALEQQVTKTVTQQLEKRQHQIFLTSAWYQELYKNLSRIIQRSAMVLAEHEKRGEFRPYALEVSFGTDEADSLSPLVLELADGRTVQLRGRIDRIDMARSADDAHTYLRIIDYKSSYKGLNLWEIYNGLKLQLVLYLEVALKALMTEEAVKPAGMFYFQVADPILRVANSLELNAETKLIQLLKALKLSGYALDDKAVIQMMDGQIADSSLLLPVTMLKSGEFGARSALCSEEGFKLLQAHSKKVLIQASERMLQGEVSVSPYQAGKKSACDYCEYASVCRFDLSIPGQYYRKIELIPDQGIWEILDEGGEVE